MAKTEGAQTGERQLSYPREWVDQLLQQRRVTITVALFGPTAVPLSQRRVFGVFSPTVAVQLLHTALEMDIGQ